MIFTFIFTAFLTPLIASIRSQAVLGVLWTLSMIGHGMCGFSLLGTITYGIPTLMAAWYCAVAQGAAPSWHLRILFALLNLLCMGIFMTHPVGSQAWPYALYWLISATVILIPHNSLVLSALGATFTAHALGSIRVLLCFGLSAPAWLALIPVVAVERLLCVLALLAGASIAQLCVVLWCKIRKGLVIKELLSSGRSTRLECFEL